MDPAEKEALMAELSAMKPLALAKRAGEIGVNEKKIEEADEAEDRKTAFIALIEQHLAQPPPTMRALVNRREGESLLYSVEEVPTPTVMGEKDLICKIEASPINPSDLGKLGLTARLGGDSVSALEGGGGGVTCKLPADAPLPDDFNQQCGNEAAAIVVAAGAHPEAQRLMGKRVAIKTGQCYAQYAKTTVDEPYFAALPEGMSAEEGASVYVNPLTVIGFVDTMRAEGHTALVHTAAGSQLGRMLVKHCKTEGVELVNIVRSEAAAAALSEIGAEHIVSSASPTYKEDLIAACKATGATLGFDATGGGTLAAEIITAMEAALKLNGTAAHPAYGTATLKQVYRYGGLQKGPTELPMSLGMAWGVGGWLMPFHFDKRGPDHLRASIDHAVAGLTTTFATSYGKRLSLDVRTSLPSRFRLRFIWGPALSPTPAPTGYPLRRSDLRAPGDGGGCGELPRDAVSTHLPGLCVSRQHSDESVCAGQAARARNSWCARTGCRPRRRGSRRRYALFLILA
eukprot:COSAG04_NODE_1691_length_5913_cov_22.836773_1_plen_514_part_00